MDRCVKVCFVVPNHWSYVIGGAQYQVKLLIERLQNIKKVEIYLIVENVSTKYQAAGYTLFALNNTSSNSSRFYNSIKLFFQLYKIHPDVIYQRVGCSFTGISALYARISGCRFIWNIAHDNDLDLLKNGDQSHNRKYWWDRVMLAMGIHLARIIIPQSKEQAEILTRNYHKPKMEPVRNFHPDYPDKKQFLYDFKSLKILWIANIRPEKNPDAFIKLAETFVGFPQNIEFLMIGHPSSDITWQKDLEARIKTINNLKYLGPKDIEEVNRYIKDAYALVNTSLSEGFPNTFVQAWMRSVPVISLNVNPDGALDGQGIGFHAHNNMTLVQVLKYLVQNPIERIKMGARAYQYAQKYHSIHNADLIIKKILLP